MSDIAYYTNEGFFDPDKGAYQVALIERDEPGFSVVALLGTYEQAAASVEKFNADAGIARDEVLEIVASSMAVTHRWQYARFTGTKTCERCGLLPLDDDDTSTRCTGSREN